jgi:hypothetical protein
MSSSSSLAAARRRRGGAQMATPPAPTYTQNTPSKPQPNTTPSQNGQQLPSSNGAPPNPYVILQQHHVKINTMDKAIRELELEMKSNLQRSSSSSNTTVPADVDKMTESILNRIDSQFNLNVLYENDERLSTEIDALQKLIQSQQIIINSLNGTLHYIIQQLDIKSPSVTTNDNLNIDSELPTTDGEVYDDMTMTDLCHASMMPPAMPDDSITTQTM